MIFNLTTNKKLIYHRYESEILISISNPECTKKGHCMRKM